ncbi:MAG TPA: hypothetical protein VHB72_02585 [Candidatus Saccharimonadales bacterium]|nr:hypothetical protein [Candidatus Saccharimonadales bacterium]
MASPETANNEGLTAKDLFPNPLQRMVFRLCSFGDAYASHISAKRQTRELREITEVVENLDRDNTDSWLDTFYHKTKEEIYEVRQEKRWTKRCEEVVDQAIGSVAVQRMALAYLEN